MYIKRIKAIIHEKLLSSEYQGARGIAFFIVKGVFRVFEQIISILEHKLILFYKKVAASNDKTEIDILFVQTNGLGDAIINKVYNDLLIKSLHLNKNRIFIVAFDTWVGLKEKLHPDISVFFINKKKFEWNLAYRFRVYIHLSKYSCRYVVCNLRWKPRYVIKKLLPAITGQQFFISAHEDSEPVQKLLFESWCKKEEFHYIDLSHIDSEFIRIPAFYREIFGKDFHDQGPQRTILPRSSLETSICTDRPYVVFHFGGSDRRKCLGLEKFMETGRKIVSEGYKIVFVGGASERDLIGHINEDGFTILIDALTLEDYCTLLSGATAYLGGDTGPSHLAVALNVPSVIIVGGGAYGYYFPYPDDITPKMHNVIYCHADMDCYACDWKCKLPVESHWACVHSISADHIKNKIICLLSKTE